VQRQPLGATALAQGRWTWTPRLLTSLELHIHWAPLPRGSRLAGIERMSQEHCFSVTELAGENLLLAYFKHRWLTEKVLLDFRLFSGPG
jgi:hypothetical protein